MKWGAFYKMAVDLHGLLSSVCESASGILCGCGSFISPSFPMSLPTNT